MATTDPQVLQEALTQIARGHTGRVLVFEPDTGEILRAAPRRETFSGCYPRWPDG